MMCLGICSLRFALIIESRFTFLAAPHPAPQIWNIFCHYLFEYIFSSIILSIFCLLSFKGFRTIVFVIVSEELFFFCLCFCCSDWIIYIVLSVHYSFLWIFIWLLSPIYWVVYLPLILVFFLFSLKIFIPFVFFLYILFVHWVFIFSSFISSIP